AHTCIEFPDDFRVGVNGSNEIKFYVDHSKTDMVEIIRNVVVERLSQRTAEISEERTEDVLSRVEAVDDIISEQAVVLKDISSELNTAEDDIDEALDGFEYINSLIGGSDGRMDEMDDLSSDMLDYSEIMRDEAYDAVDIGQSHIDTNHSDYEALSKIEDRVEETYNDTHEARTDVLNLIREDKDGASDIDSSVASVEEDVLSAKDSVKKSMGLVIDVGSAFAQASDDFAGIEGTENITSPVKTKLEPVVAERAPLSYMFPTLLVMVIMLVSVMLAGTLVVVEKTSNSFFRNFVTPTSDISFIAGIFFANIIVTFTQSLLIILMASLVFGGVMLTNLLTIAVALLIISALFTLLGMLLGYLFNTQEMVSLAGITVSSLFIMLSGVIIPLEQMPEYMIKYTAYNPLLMGEGILRRSIIFQTELINEAIMRDVFMIVGFSLVLLLLVIVTQKAKKEVFLNGSNLFRKKKVTEEDVKEDDGPEGRKEKKGLDFLEDYVGDENASRKKGSMLSAAKKKISSSGVFTRLTSKLRPKSKVDEVVYTGDEEMTYGVDAEDDTDHDDESDSDAGKNEEHNKDTTDSESPDLKNSKKTRKKPSKARKDNAGKKSKSSSIKATKKYSQGEADVEELDDASPEQSEPMLTRKLEPYQYFVLSSGVIIKSFGSLIEELNSMDDDTFEYHVGEDRNDFYLWIKNVLKQEKAAEKIRKIKDPKKMAKILKRFLR
ncbi:MAG: ABC transporter permease, partial [Candidatus Woesearchaeota archaeon]